MKELKEQLNEELQKELDKWKRARKNPVSDEELKQQYRNKQSNAKGHDFEDAIVCGCKYYQEREIAWIDKTPEPFRVMSKSKNGIFTGRFTSNAQPDFQGTLKGGKSIIFEAKKTGKDRILRNVVTKTQQDVLEAHHKLGAACFVCVCIQEEVFFIPWEKWRDMKKYYGRLYMKADDIREYQVGNGGRILFLANEM